MTSLAPRIEQLARLRCQVLEVDPDRVVPAPAGYTTGSRNEHRPTWAWEARDWARDFALYEAAIALETKGEKK